MTRQHAHRAAIQLFCLFLLFLTAAPRARLMPSLPVYLIDMLLVGVWLCLILEGRPLRIPKRGVFTLALVVFALMSISEWLAFFRVGRVDIVMYVWGQALLAVSLCVLPIFLLRSADEVLRCSTYIAAGTIISSILLISTSIPGVGRVIASVIFGNPWLEPAARVEDVVSAGASAQRGRSLVGISNLAGAFVVAGWPFVLYVLRSARSSLWQLTLGVGAMLVPVAAFLTYSRGTLLAIGITMLAMAVLGGRTERRGVVVAVVVLIAGLAYIGIDSDTLMVDRYVDRFSAVFTDPLDDIRERDRIMSYLGPITSVGANPSSILIGEGLSGAQLLSRGAGGDYLYAGDSSHSVFAKGFHAYGLLCVLLLLAIFAAALAAVVASLKRSGGHRHFAAVLVAVLLAESVWLAVGHAAVSQARGSYLFWWLIGMALLVAVRPGLWTPSGSHS